MKRVDGREQQLAKRNMLFIGITLIALCCFILYTAVIYFSDGTSKPNASQLEARNYQEAPNFTPASFESGAFQSELEKYVSDNMPNRDDLILRSSSWQYSLMSFANLPFAFDAVPTYFGSNYSYSSGTGMLLERPAQISNYPNADVKAFAQYASHLISLKDNCRWRFFLPDRVNISKASPLHDEINNIADYDYVAGLLREGLPENCQLVNLSYQDSSEYTSKYFATDHHMQIEGAIDAYREIMRSLDKEVIDFKDVYLAYDGEFFGSNARLGRFDKISDVIFDVDYERSRLDVEADGVRLGDSDLDKSYAEKSGETFQKESKFVNVYVRWFHANWGLMTLTNDSLPDDAGAILLIGDSTDNNYERFFAESYKRVYSLDLRYYNGSAEEFLSSHDDIVDAVFTLSQGSYRASLANQGIA